MKLTTFSDVESYLGTFTPNKPGAYKLDRITKLMKLLGNPQEKLSIIHVAGTSGKTSTAYYCSALLTAAGAKVGLTVSPHVFEINERVQINTQPLGEKKFCQLFEKFIAIGGVEKLQPTYFELLVAFAFWSFVEEGCTHAVIEVGLGGLLDGTNVISSPNKVVVITDIGLDHTHILGNSVEEIAFQKAGIIKSHNQVFMYYQDEAIQDVVLGVCRNNHATLHRFDQSELEVTYKISGSLPLYQRRNWLLAVQATDFVIFRDDLDKLNARSMSATQKTVIPGRMQTITYQGEEIVLDGAHNPQKLSALCDSIQQRYPRKTVACLLAFAGSKQATIIDSLKVIHEMTDIVIITDFAISEDYAHTSLACSEVAELASSVGFDQVHYTREIPEALEWLIKQNADVKLVTGSFYLIAAMKPFIKDSI